MNIFLLGPTGRLETRNMLPFFLQVQPFLRAQSFAYLRFQSSHDCKGLWFVEAILAQETMLQRQLGGGNVLVSLDSSQGELDH